MKKVMIIGCPGSGKSTFSKSLNSILSIPLYHLDMMYWNEDKTIVEKDVFLTRLKNALSRKSWIIDGNYMSTMEMRLSECDTVFFLDYPTDVCIKGIEARKGKKRSDMPWVEADTYDEEFITFIKSFNIETKPKIIDLLKKYPLKNIIIFKSRIEADKYLLSLKK